MMNNTSNDIVDIEVLFIEDEEINWAPFTMMPMCREKNSDCL